MVTFGATVTLVDEDTEEKVRYQIVGEFESNVREGRMRCLAGSERIAGPGMIELAERDRVARGGRSALLDILTDELEHAGHAPGVSFRRDEGRAVADRTGQHTRDRHLAAVRGVQRLEHQR